MVEFTVLDLYHEIRSWRQRNSKVVGDILGEKQHKFFMIGIVVVLKHHYDIIMTVRPK
jgi:hypothetical protein